MVTINSIQSAACGKGRLGAILACLLMVCLSSTAAQPQWTGGWNDLGAGSESPQLTSLTSSGPGIQAVGKKVRSPEFENLFDAIDGQVQIFFAKDSFLFVRDDSADAAHLAEHPVIQIRAPPLSLA